jgi:hypothetical protein
VKRPQPHLLVVAVCGWLLVSSSAPHGAQTPAGPDGITRLLQKLEEVVRAGDPARYHGLLAAGAAGIETAGAAALAQSIIGPGATRVVVRERDRVPLIGVQPGAGRLHRVHPPRPARHLENRRGPSGAGLLGRQR